MWGYTAVSTEIPMKVGAKEMHTFMALANHTQTSSPRCATIVARAIVRVERSEFEPLDDVNSVQINSVCVFFSCRTPYALTVY